MTVHSSEPVKFAYWVPNVSGGLVISNIEQRTSWDIDYNIKLARIAEQAGFDYALSQIRFTAGYGAEYQHESVSFSHALLAATEKLKVIAAILPGPWAPALAAKQIATINHLTKGRVAVNIVSGWFRGEFAAIGLPWLDHDERYRRSEEFIRALRGIWTQDAFTHKGFFYHFDNYSLKPKPIEPLPEIFQGGSSRAARDMASRVSDWYFTNGNTPDEIAKQVDDIQAKAGLTAIPSASASTLSRLPAIPKPKPRLCSPRSFRRRTPRRSTPSRTRSRMPGRRRRRARGTGRSRHSTIWFNITTASGRI